MPGSTTAHIINHTHWDREWFLTSEYTTRWIPRLIDRLEELVAENPNYRFLLDGQTLVIEDLLALVPEYTERVQALISAGNLLVGPYYCQPDWQLSDGELLIRNLLYGAQDVGLLGGAREVGWLVDTFGHISQSPQIHRLFAIEAAYVWRGVPHLHPYFVWEGPDGSTLLTMNLFGGYRNLYGVTHVPQVAVRRLHAELRRLAPYYPTPDVPLFDGYDLEDDPEDPLAFYAQTEVPADVNLHETTPAAFAGEIANKQLSLPTIAGELHSGKYGATFPGTLSARTYLKIMAHDCERLLFKLVEPLAVLARLQGRPYQQEQYEAWGRRLLQNAVHDCICGVSIDQVHEKMEFSYRQDFQAMLQDAEASLSVVMADFAPGQYAISTSPFTGDDWQVVDDSLVHVHTEGIGIWPVGERLPVERVSELLQSFTWCNDHYEATVEPDGTVRIGEGVLGSLIVSEEHGDTYSTEPGERLGVIRSHSPLSVIEKSELHCVLHFRGRWRREQRRVTVDVRLHFDPSPLIRWDIDLDSRGADLRVDMVFERPPGKNHLYAAMPFDVVRRPLVDTNLLPRELPDELAGVLLGQRELGSVSYFPFRDFVAASDGYGNTLAILSRGTRTYCANEDGSIILPLRRTVEWLTRADLPGRVGDAGPFFYVPDARCERRIRHMVAVVAGDFAPDSMTVQRLNAHFQNPPLIVRAQGDGTRTRWQLLEEELPLSGLSICNEAILARFFNPTSNSQPFSRSYRRSDVWGNPGDEIPAAPSKKIVTVQLSQPLPTRATAAAAIELLTPPPWRVGPNRGRPDPAILVVLEEKIAELAQQVAQAEAQMAAAQGAEQLRLQHRIYVLQREQLEYQLSHLLNRRKLAEDTALRYEYLYEPDPDIAEVGQALNRLRIQRRIFDYVVQAL